MRIIWGVLNKLDLTRRLDTFIIKHFSFDKESRRIDFTFEEAWKVFRYSLNIPDFEGYLNGVKISASIFAFVGLPYMFITILVKLFL